MTFPLGVPKMDCTYAVPNQQTGGPVQKHETAEKPQFANPTIVAAAKHVWLNKILVRHTNCGKVEFGNMKRQQDNRKHKAHASEKTYSCLAHGQSLKLSVWHYKIFWVAIESGGVLDELIASAEVHLICQRSEGGQVKAMDFSGEHWRP